MKRLTNGELIMLTGLGVALIIFAAVIRPFCDRGYAVICYLLGVAAASCASGQFLRRMSSNQPEGQIPTVGWVIIGLVALCAAIGTNFIL